MSVVWRLEFPISPPIAYWLKLSQRRTAVPVRDKIAHICHLRTAHGWIEAICLGSSSPNPPNWEITGSGACSGGPIVS